MTVPVSMMDLNPLPWYKAFEEQTTNNLPSIMVNPSPTTSQPSGRLVEPGSSDDLRGQDWMHLSTPSTGDIDIPLDPTTPTTSFGPPPPPTLSWWQQYLRGLRPLGGVTIVESTIAGAQSAQHGGTFSGGFFGEIKTEAFETAAQAKTVAEAIKTREDAGDPYPWLPSGGGGDTSSDSSVLPPDYFPQALLVAAAITTAHLLSRPSS